MAEHEHGKMDVTEQEKTFAGFMKWTTRVVIVILVVLVLMAIYIS